MDFREKLLKVLENLPALEGSTDEFQETRDKSGRESIRSWVEF